MLWAQLHSCFLWMLLYFKTNCFCMQVGCVLCQTIGSAASGKPSGWGRSHVTHISGVWPHSLTQSQITSLTIVGRTGISFLGLAQMFRWRHFHILAMRTFNLTQPPQKLNSYNMFMSLMWVLLFPDFCSFKCICVSADTHTPQPLCTNPIKCITINFTTELQTSQCNLNCPLMQPLNFWTLKS